MGKAIIVAIDEKPVTIVEKTYTLQLTEKQFNSLVSAAYEMDTSEVMDSAENLGVQDQVIVSENEWQIFMNDLVGIVQGKKNRK